MHVRAAAHARVPPGTKFMEAVSGASGRSLVLLDISSVYLSIYVGSFNLPELYNHNKDLQFCSKQKRVCQQHTSSGVCVCVKVCVVFPGPEAADVPSVVRSGWLITTVRVRPFGLK